MSTIHLLKLTGLSCRRCVKRLTDALSSFSDIHIIKLDRDYACLESEKNTEQLIDIINQSGYTASLAESPDYKLSLSGLHCQSCVKKVKLALEQIEGVMLADVTLTCAKIYGHVPLTSLLTTIADCGFSAQQQNIKYDESSHSHSVNISAVPIKKITSSDKKVIHYKKNSPSTHEEQSKPSTTHDTLTSIDDDDSMAISISGMSCASCVAKVEKTLQHIPGVKTVTVNLIENMAYITPIIDSHLVISALQQAGYNGELLSNTPEQRSKKKKILKKQLIKLGWQAALSLIVAIFLMIWSMLYQPMLITAETQLSGSILGGITLILMLVTGYHFYWRALTNLRHAQTTMDTLIALGTTIAWIYSMLVTVSPEYFPESARHVYFEACLMIIGMINLGKFIELKGKSKASHVLEKLLALAPTSVKAVIDGKETIIPVTKITLGMTLHLVTGDRVPVDGVISQGEIWVDESMLTGEARPCYKQQNDTIYAGTIIHDGNVFMKTTTIGQHTTLARIIKLVREAQNSKPAIAQLVDKVAAIFVPTVIIVAIISAFIWYMIGPSPHFIYAFIIFTTVLIIACPCALGLATPMSITAGVGRAAELGILIRDAEALQQASQVDTIVMDKTGTLTTGKPQLIHVTTFNNYDETTIISLATELEKNTNHPLAKAILEQTIISVITIPSIQHIKTLRGLGVSGESEKYGTLLLGSPALLLKQHIDLNSAMPMIEQHARQGTTPVLLAINHQLVGLFTIKDTLREDAIAITNSLKQQGYQLIMLTGDNQFTAQAIAQELALDQVAAELLPEGKTTFIHALQQSGRSVAMIGDGINDAPALAQANVGIAMNNGSDIAMESASITLMQPGLKGLIDALSLAKATLKNMKQNLFGAFIYNIIAIPVAAGILYPIWGILLNPVIAGVAMALSSITVVTNANRLTRFNPRHHQNN